MKKSHPTPSRICALEILSDLERKKAQLQDLLYRKLDKLEQADRALTTRLVMGVLRLRGQLDWVWETHSKRPKTQIDPVVANILRLGCYQHLFCEGIATYALVNESVLLARYFRRFYAAGFVNAVLRSVTRAPVPSFPDPAPADSINRLAKLLSHPEWLLKRWIGRFGLDETVKLCRFNNTEPAHFIRVNTAQTTPEKLALSLDRKGWKPQPVEGLPEAIRITPAGNPSAEPGYRSGWYDIQGLVSMLVGYVVNPQAGDLVLDACAGRGGKAAYLAQLMGEEGSVIAGDINPVKLGLLQENLRRLKVEIVYPMGYNGVELSFQKNFDRILLDAPCSNLGVVGRYPDIKWSRTEGEIVNASRLQKKLLAHLANYVKPGGVIIYAVCSFESEETEEIIEGFLSGQNKFKRENIRDFLPQHLKESITPGGYWFPQYSKTEGFFCARLRRLR